MLRSGAGESNESQRSRVQEVRIEAVQPIDGFPYVINLKAEVVDTRLTAGAPGQKRQADDSVANVSAIGVRLAVLIHQTGGDLLHAENCFVEVALFVVVFGMGGEVADFCDHSGSPSEVCG